MTIDDVKKEIAEEIKEGRIMELKASVRCALGKLELKKGEADEIQERIDDYYKQIEKILQNEIIETQPL
jgi:hypothetical protein